MKPTAFESEVLNLIVADKYPDLLRKIYAMEVSDRISTGVGLTVNFDVPKAFGPFGERRMLKANADASRVDFPYTIDFLLGVENGWIAYIEFIANGGDSFPENLDGFAITSYET